jgi:hypothetical protein
MCRSCSWMSAGNGPRGRNGRSASTLSRLYCSLYPRRSSTRSYLRIGELILPFFLCYHWFTTNLVQWSVYLLIARVHSSSSHYKHLCASVTSVWVWVFSRYIYKNKYISVYIYPLPIIHVSCGVRDKIKD